MSRYDDDSYSRGRSNHHHHHHHDRAPDYTYSTGDYPISYEESRRLAEEGAAGPKLLTYEPQEPPYPPSNLQVPDVHSRPRSLPPPVEYRRSSRGRRTERGHDRYDDDDYSDDEHRARTPVEKARKFVDNTFSNSTTGLGVGVLGALVGGLAVREAVDATAKHEGGQHRRSDSEYKRNQLIGTVVGAAVGALGANAVEKRLEVHRDRDRVRQEKWDRKYRPASGAGDIVEKREVVTRPRSSEGGYGGGGWKKDWDPWEQRERDRDRRRSRGGVEREVDPDARSWKNVEEWLYDDRNDSRSGRRSAEGEYRY
ncbi:hypothetical protein F4821DRAFT_160999 [Hypoxylon rubiginosum]|uniref:Uncharacterized protein n=1 Tax=Hypoxylon rubiginosum TaxID=110542 RepID=A0ACC0CX29_9PEZI|nr:hypothetical protein F4821DRAFT_160999 [Hypoxylon rubiginosum]